MDAESLADQASNLATGAAKLSQAAEKLAQQSTELIIAQAPAMTGAGSSFLSLFIILSPTIVLVLVVNKTLSTLNKLKTK